MLKLPVIKPRPYLSPSAFFMWKNCRFQFYNYYLAGHKRIDRLATKASLVGSYFDAFVKDYVAVKRAFPNRPDLQLDRLLDNIDTTGVDDAMATEAKTLGKDIAKGYIDHNMVKPLMQEPHVDLDRELYGHWGKVPILGILDGLIGTVPLDFKLRGFGGDKTISPHKGYNFRMDQDGTRKNPHEFANRIKMEDVNEKWAIQMAFYCKLTGNERYEFVIHEIVKTKNGWDIAQHSNRIGTQFIKQLEQDLHRCWEDISGMNANILEPQPTQWRCEAYGKVCEVAHLCRPYQTTLAKPRFKEMYLNAKDFSDTKVPAQPTVSDGTDVQPGDGSASERSTGQGGTS